MTIEELTIDPGKRWTEDSAEVYCKRHEILFGYRSSFQFK